MFEQRTVMFFALFAQLSTEPTVLAGAPTEQSSPDR
jgi:hypothetical protein